MSQTTEYNRSRVGVRVQTCYRGKERHRPSHCNYSKLTHRCPNSTYSRSCNTRVFIINLQVFDRWETGKSLDCVKSHLEYKGTKLSVYLILHFMAELPYAPVELAPSLSPGLTVARCGAWGLEKQRGKSDTVPEVWSSLQLNSTVFIKNNITVINI